MSDPLLTQLGRLTAVATGTAVFAAEGDHTCTVTITGSGGVSATALWQGSNDAIGWVTLATLSPSGTGVGSAKAATTETYRYWRLNVTALTGDAVAAAVSSEASSGTSAGAVSGAVISYATNAAALKPAASALAGASLSDVIFGFHGDSLTQFGGDTVNQTSDTKAEAFGFAAQFRRIVNARLGTLNGGQFIGVEAAPSDTRIAVAGVPVVVAGYAAVAAYRDSGGTINVRRAYSLEGAGQGVDLTITGRYLTVMVWENAANSYNGTFSYAIDGGGATNVASLGQTDTFRLVSIDLGTNTAHTVAIRWVSNKVLLCGFMVTTGAGLTTLRFGQGGSTTKDWATGFNARVRRSTMQTFPMVMQCIRFSYNDANRQSNGAYLTTPDVFKGFMQTLIDTALANAATKTVLLLADPPSSTVFAPFTLADYVVKLRELANENPAVCFFDMDAALNSTFTAGNNLGYYVDFVHRTEKGYMAEANLLAELLLQPSLLAV